MKTSKGKAIRDSLEEREIRGGKSKDPINEETVWSNFGKPPSTQKLGTRTRDQREVSKKKNKP